MTNQEAVETLKEMLRHADAKYIDAIEYAITGLSNAFVALQEINHYNRIGNDVDAYLYDLAEWGILNKGRSRKILE